MEIEDSVIEAFLLRVLNLYLKEYRIRLF